MRAVTAAAANLPGTPLCGFIMCKASDEPGGPRRCSADPRAQLQRSVDRVEELERRRDQLAQQIAALTAQRAQLAEAIDREHEHLYEAITATKPSTIISDRNGRVRVGYSVRGGEPFVGIAWHGAIGAVSWDGRADLDEQTAHALAEALSGPPPEPWQVKSLRLPHSSYEFIYARQSPSAPGPLVLDVVERDAQGRELQSHTFKLNVKAVNSLCRALRKSASGLSGARSAPPADQLVAAPAESA